MRLKLREKKEEELLNVTEGPMLKKMFLFAVPIIISGVLQVTFNTADTVVVGRFAGHVSLAAVSSTGSLINLLVSLFGGMSIGAAVAISQAIGANREKDASLHAHNAVATALLFGIVVGTIGFLFCPYFLRWMGTPDNVLPLAETYMRIYFCGTPFIMLYNYGSAIMRTTGDTKRPLFYLITAGIINVILNVVFVLGFHMDVAGVALATTISNLVSSSLVLYTLCHSNHCCAINIRRVRLHKKQFIKIIALGLPAGIQGSMFSISNVVLQSSINSFGDIVIAGNGAAAAIDAYAGLAIDGFSQAAMTFAGQNVGARKYKRLKKVFATSVICGVGIAIFLSLLVVPLRESLMRIFITDSPEAIQVGCERVMYVFLPQFIGAIMSVAGANLRGMGKSIVPMFTTIFGVCIVRILWVWLVFPHFRSLKMLYVLYPMTWLITAIVLVLMFVKIYRDAVSGKRELKI